MLLLEGWKVLLATDIFEAGGREKRVWDRVIISAWVRVRGALIR